MNFRILLLSLLVLILTPLKSQNTTFVPFSNDGLWGYMYTDSEIVIAPKFEQAKIFHPQARTDNQRLGQVKEGGFWGVMNAAGEYVLEPKFDTIVNLELATTKGALIQVRRGGRDQYFDHNGRRTRRFDFRYSYSCGKAFRVGCLSPEKIDLINVVELAKEGERKYNLVSSWQERIDGKVQTLKDTVELLADHIYIMRNWVFFERDGKTAIINRHHIYGRSEDLLSRLKFSYDEIGFFSCTVSPGPYAFDTFLKVRVGNHWGILQLNVHRLDPPEVILSPLYKSIINRDTSYFLVEYEDQMLGYISDRGVNYW
ncbi:MAG: WG repeat-containing protein [Bacteroidota bacterium]